MKCQRLILVVSVKAKEICNDSCVTKIVLSVINKVICPQVFQAILHDVSIP